MQDAMIAKENVESRCLDTRLSPPAHASFAAVAPDPRNLQNVDAADWLREFSMVDGDEVVVKRVRLSSEVPNGLLAQPPPQPQPPMLSSEQNRVLELFRRGENVFVTGPGGCGKSHVLRAVVSEAKVLGKCKLQVCAMTGRAAVQLDCRARTIHSWSGIRLCKGARARVVSQALRKLESVCYRRSPQPNWRTVDVLIIDEVSMMSRKVLEVLDMVARAARRCPGRAFGGIQVLFFGDFFQLPPTAEGVSSEDVDGDADADGDLDLDDGSYAFESPVWQELFGADAHVQLTRIYRQAGDDAFIKMLSQVREGRLTRRTHEQLQSRVVATPSSDAEEREQCTRLYPLRATADALNARMFARLEGVSHRYEWIRQYDLRVYLDDKSLIEARVVSQASALTREQQDGELSGLLQCSPCVEVLELKIGAQVMLCANLDVESGLCNGSLGVVVGFTRTVAFAETGSKVAAAVAPAPALLYPLVRFRAGGVRAVGPQMYQSANVPTLGFSQVPLKLSWGMTIHSSQGATLDSAEIDVGKGVFAVGQTYVALSRVRALEGLWLLGYDLSKIKVSAKVKEFYERFSGPDSGEILRSDRRE